MKYVEALKLAGIVNEESDPKLVAKHLNQKLSLLKNYNETFSFESFLNMIANQAFENPKKFPIGERYIDISSEKELNNYINEIKKNLNTNGIPENFINNILNLLKIKIKKATNKIKN